MPNEHDSRNNGPTARVYAESNLLLRPDTPASTYTSSAGYSSDGSGIEVQGYGSIPRRRLSRAYTLHVPSEIENKGSTARDFYAAERNYLSWVRLSLALASTGAAVLTDFRYPGRKKPEYPSFLSPARWLNAIEAKHHWLTSLCLQFLAAFTLVTTFVVFYHTHSQLAVAKRPLLWSRMLVVSMTLAIAVAVVAAAASTLYYFTSWT
ncbi:hypothetical protein GGI25_004495 [Coemansia spiralis]|uniref:DUF202 domain-containing protein n=2 Tax=Coemansia TaxID=4863 RepID=A0A9W8G4F5_9FUNG|nr:hypothetical protein BX070DRAFT_254540 [Coemansia spiralis]KAJ1987467.1 hypothetical protein EDC05_005828 [Coemansia umbellata]KAJ2619296.1 hypothetical protein GGI26_005941 [Coemansia sp. RSA 1358]KAJ2674010.1 hypothetical protein GGI25_004495 [Coemansia spiralis]